MSLTIYKASAGSGKTFTLAVEYIRRLVENPAAVFAYRETLAVTFTNKATAEMKDRILETLYAIAHALPSGEPYLKAVMKSHPLADTPNGEAEIRERCRQALCYILHDYSRFRVETIDAFFQSIVRDLARELGLTAGLQTELDTETTTSDAVDCIFDNLDSDNRDAATPHANNILRARIARFVRQRIDEGRSWDVQQAVKRFASHIFDSEYQDISPTLAPLLQDEDFLRAYIREVEAKSAVAAKLVEQDIEQLEQTVAELGIGFEDFSNGRYITSHIAKTRRGEQASFGKSLTNFVEDPMKLLRKPDQRNPEMQEAARMVSERLGILQQTEDRSAIDTNTATLIRNNLNELCLLGTIEKEVNRITTERGSFLLANTPQLLSRLVAEGDTPFIYEKMGAKLQHVMLDEFQDTSRRQWHNFRTLLDDNMDRGGSTLIVGDVKQSIYRWRDGDWQILHRLHDEMLRYNPQVVTLKTNWRSYSEIVNFNNRLYQGAARLLGLSDIYADVEQDPTPGKQGGYVQITCYDKKSEDSTTATLTEMCHHIRTLHDCHGVPWREMAILIRNNSDEASIASAFDRMLPGVPLISGGVFRLGSSRAIRVVIDALRCLHDPSDKATMACLRYAVGGGNESEGRSVNDLLHQEDDTSPISTYFAQRDKLVLMPLYELVMYTVAHFGVSSMEGQSAYLLTFYDQLQAFVGRRPAGIAQLLEEYDRRMATATVAGCEVDGVGVLTIHKAKGLEWHTVFIPFADWPMERSREMLWCSTHGVKPYCALPIVPVETGIRMAASIFDKEYEHEMAQQHTDNLNLLYVATTRPTGNLFVWGKHSGKQNIMSIIRQSLPEGWQAADGQGELYTAGTLAPFKHKSSPTAKERNRLHPEYTAVSVTSTPSPATSDGLTVDTQPFLPTTSFVQSGEAGKFVGHHEPPEHHGHQDTGEADGRSGYIEQGLLLHAIFERLRTADDLPHVLSTFEASGLIADSAMRQRTERLVRAGLANPRVAPWFAPGLTLFNECSILTTGNDGNVVERRPDRVIVDNDTVTVVDYKFGRPKADHVKQVDSYKQLMHNLYPTRQVKGYLWYVYQNHVEETY